MLHNAPTYTRSLVYVLTEKLPDFKRGYLEDGLSVEEFEDFGPVRLFKSAFTKSWAMVLDTIKEQR